MSISVTNYINGKIADPQNILLSNESLYNIINTAVEFGFSDDKTSDKKEGAV